MASVTFSSAVGGDNTTVDDTAGPNGLDAGGHRLRFVPALANLVAIAAYVINSVTGNKTAAEAAAASALGAPGTNASSTTSLAIGTGSKSLTLAQTGKAYSLGQTVNLASAANVANAMVGVITAFNSGTGAMTINVPVGGTFGSGTFADWIVSLGATAGVQSVAGLTGAVSSAALKTALALTISDVTNYSSDQNARDTASDKRAVAFSLLF